MTWTDVLCFTCGHEVRQTADGAFEHADPDDKESCECIGQELECGP